MEISERFLLYLCVCPGESLAKFYHRLAAGPRGEGRVTVRHPGTHQLGRLWPTQDHQRGETQGEGKASAALLQRGQVGSVRCKWCIILFPRSNTHSRVPPVEIRRWQLLCVLHVCVLSSGRRSCVSARRPRWSRWRGTRPNTWEASRGSIPEREERNTTSTLNTAARSSRRRRRPKPERSVPGTRSSFQHTRYCTVTEVVIQKQWRSKSRQGA